jgi:3-methyl-2-oxobutanoate hydroxymethyltransferase
MSETQQQTDERVTIREVRRWVRQGQAFAVLTCYDATTARWLWRGGLRVMLVGDSAAQVVLGYEHTLQITLADVLTMSAAVRRGAPGSYVMADLPYASGLGGERQLMADAGRLLMDGGADAVKLEAGPSRLSVVQAIADAGTPVVVHLGWRPQQTGRTGVPQVAGKSVATTDELVSLAQQMERAGAVMLLLEACTAEAAKAVVDAVRLPVIGCGAGPACHGQVLVLHDWLGLSDWQPSFATPGAAMGESLRDAAAAWVERVEAGEHLADGGPYRQAGA